MAVIELASTTSRVALATTRAMAFNAEQVVSHRIT